MSGPAELTPVQRELARHALGLPNDRNRSYRNRYVVYAGADKYVQWRGMVEIGAAEVSLQDNAMWFRLTLAGALLALDEGETLDVEDFSP